jgi:GT2 family glycosyltransferase
MSSNPTIPRFSIVIVHRNGRAMLLETLARLADAMREDDAVMVVDNGSSDGSITAIRQAHPHARVIENGCNNGFAAACNQGISATNSEFVLLLNNDAFVTADTLNALARTFLENPHCAATSPRLVGDDGRPQRSHGRLPDPLGELGLRSKAGRFPPLPEGDIVEVESVIGACMAIRRTAIADVGLMDEAFFFYFEETDWCRRFRAAGWTILLTQNAQVTHLKGASTKGRRRGTRIEMFRSRITYYDRAFSRPVAYSLTCYRILRLVINTVFHAAATLLTLGLHKGLRAKFVDYAYVLAWLSAGWPWKWGLPDKCPPHSTLSRKG